MGNKTMLIASIYSHSKIAEIYSRDVDYLGKYVPNSEWLDRLERFYLEESIRPPESESWYLYKVDDPDFIDNWNIWAEDLWVLFEGFGVKEEEQGRNT